LIGRFIAFSALFLAGATASAAAPVCIENQSGQSLFLVADDGAGQRAAGMTESGKSLCVESQSGDAQATVGVFASADAEEGCSRLTRPGQLETLLDFVEFDRCSWVDTDRNF